MMKRVLAAFLSFLLTVQPVVWLPRIYATLGLAAAALALPTAAYASDEATINAAVAEAKGTGSSSLKGFPQTTTDGTNINVTMTTPSGTKTQSNTTTGTDTSIFGKSPPEQSGDVAAAQSSYGNQSGWNGAIGATTTRLNGEQSSQGDAYRLMKNGGRTLPKSEVAAGVYSFSTDAVNSPFTECSTSQSTTINTKSSTVYTEESCTKPNQPFSQCDVERNLSFHTPISGTASGMTASSCGPNCYELVYDLPVNCGGNNDCGERNASWVFNVETTDVQSAWAYQQCDDGCVINANGTDIEYIGDLWHETSAMHYGTPQDLIPYMTGKSNLTLSWKEHTFGSTGGYLKLHVEANQQILEDRGFISNPPNCLDYIRANARCSSTATWSCTDSNPRDVIPGVHLDGNNAASYGLTSGEIYSGEFAGVGICYHARATNACSPANTVTVTNPDGSTYDVSATGSQVSSASQASCQALEDKGCTFKSQQCLPGATDPTSGECTTYDVTYNCPGPQADIVTGATSATSITCGALRCMGNDCADPINENNQSFGNAAGAMGALDSIPMDATCDASGCLIFAGKHLECKNVLFGVQNCCGIDVSSGPSIFDYAIFVYETYKKSMALGIISKDNPINGAATSIKNYGSGAWDTVTQPFKTAWDSWVGAAADTPVGASISEVSDAFSSIGTDINQLTTYLTQDLESWVTDVFGQEVTTALFGSTGTAATAAGEEASSGLISEVMTAYGYVALVILAIQLIYKCTDDEGTLAVNKKMGQCHSLGSYCGKKDPLTGICTITQQSYCCFGSMLSRIMQEQIRLQTPAVNRPWGSPQTPDCGGLSMTEIAAADFSKVDLTEWITTLTAAGALPTAQQIVSGQMDFATRNKISGPNVSSANAADRVYGQVGTNPNTGTNVRNSVSETLKASN